VLRSLAKAYAYSRAPRATFAVLHPEQAFQLRKLPYDLEHAYAPRLVAFVALALALPVGILVGRRWERRVQRRRAIDRQARRRDRGVGRGVSGLGPRSTSIRTARSPAASDPPADVPIARR